MSEKVNLPGAARSSMKSRPRADTVGATERKAAQSVGFEPFCGERDHGEPTSS
jgi:hypothetical protein